MSDPKPDLPDAGHIHRPSGFDASYYQRQHGKPWAPREGYCHHSVHDGGRSCSFHQCSKKTKVTREVLRQGKAETHDYCGTHDPLKVAAQAAARDAKWAAERAARDAKRDEDWRQRKLAQDAIAALKQIAAGHNDPRTLAIETLQASGEGWQ